jgi:hypothetical protein
MTTLGLCLPSAETSTTVVQNGVPYELRSLLVDDVRAELRFHSLCTFESGVSTACEDRIRQG